MDHSHLSLLLALAAIAATLYGVHRVVTSLYQDFLDFSRRFRGVE
jgi:hypothetical protein